MIGQKISQFWDDNKHDIIGQGVLTVLLTAACIPAFGWMFGATYTLASIAAASLACGVGAGLGAIGISHYARQKGERPEQLTPVLPISPVPREADFHFDYRRLWKENRRDIIGHGLLTIGLTAVFFPLFAGWFGASFALKTVMASSVVNAAGSAAGAAGFRYFAMIQHYRRDVRKVTGVRPSWHQSIWHVLNVYLRKAPQPATK